MKIKQITKTKTLSYLILIAILFSVLLVTPSFAASKKTANWTYKWASVTFTIEYEEEDDAIIEITVWEYKSGKTKETMLRIRWWDSADPPPTEPIEEEFFDLDPKDFKWSMSAARVSTELQVNGETALLIVEWDTNPPTMTEHINDYIDLPDGTIHWIWNGERREATAYLYVEEDGEVLELFDLEGRVGHSEGTEVPS